MQLPQTGAFHKCPFSQNQETTAMNKPSSQKHSGGVAEYRSSEGKTVKARVAA